MNLKGTFKSVFKAFNQPASVNGDKSVLFNSNSVLPSWLTYSNYMQYYNEIPEISAIIDYQTNSFMRMRLRQFDGSSEINDTPELNLLNKPNPIQSNNDFFRQLFLNYRVFGNAYIFKGDATGVSGIGQLWVIPSDLLAPVFKESINENHYAKTLSGYQIIGSVNSIIPSDKIIHIKDTSIDGIIGTSFLSRLSMPISNINMSYEAQNVLLKSRGALGILSTNNAEFSPLSPREKDNLQEEFKKYGLTADQSHIIITNASLNWQQMAFPIKDLQLHETIENNTVAICNAAQFPIVLLNYLKGATFSNVSEFKKGLYQDFIIPTANLILNDISEGINATGKIIADYSHIEVLQSDKKTQLERESLDISNVLMLQTSVKNGVTSYDSAVNQLVLSRSITEDQAKTILGEIKVNVQITAT